MMVPRTIPTQGDMRVSSTLPSQIFRASTRQLCFRVEEVTPTASTTISQVSPI